MTASALRPRGPPASTLPIVLHPAALSARRCVAALLPEGPLSLPRYVFYFFCFFRHGSHAIPFQFTTATDLRRRNCVSMQCAWE